MPLEDETLKNVGITLGEGLQDLGRLLNKGLDEAVGEGLKDAFTAAFKPDGEAARLFPETAGKRVNVVAGLLFVAEAINAHAKAVEKLAAALDRPEHR